MNLQQSEKRMAAQVHPAAMAVLSASAETAANSRREIDLPELDLVDGGCFERLHVAASTSGFAWFRSEADARKRIQGWRDDDDHLFDDFYYFEALVADEDATSKGAITALIEGSYDDHIARHKGPAAAKRNPKPQEIQCSSRSGTYFIAVVIKTEAPVRDLSASLQAAYDQGAAGFFNVWEIDTATKRIVFERQFGDDHEMLAGRVAGGVGLVQAAAEQIAAEFAELSPGDGCVAPLIAALRDTGCVVTSGLCDPAPERNVQCSALAADPDGAAVFHTELVAAWGALGAIGAKHGIPTLSGLMSLQQAILQGETLEVWPGETEVMVVLNGLPSAVRWVKNTDLPAEWKQRCVRVESPPSNA